MLSDADRQAVKAVFDADDAQVERDHLISHALAAISADLADSVKFYGGTALARSFLSHGRLSEDIDLIAMGPRADVAEALTRTLTALRHGRTAGIDLLHPRQQPPAALGSQPAGGDRIGRCARGREPTRILWHQLLAPPRVPARAGTG
jgi:hypothetical protein